MPSITETISELDRLREKKMTTNVMDGTDEFSILLHLSYPALRRAAMAGAELAKAVEKNVIYCDGNGTNIGVYKHLSNGTLLDSANWEAMNHALSAYRSAIEEKNV